MKKLIDRPHNDYDPNNPETIFWTDGTYVYFNTGETRKEIWQGSEKSYYATHLKGANPKTFLYEGFWGKDDKKCFCGESWLKNADVETFKAVNYTYAIDKNHVYTIVGKVKDADVETFEVLDNGKSFLWYSSTGIPIYIPNGYAKDKNHVYYDNYEGKTKIIKNAHLETFKSLGDTYFASDKNHIYGNGKVLKKANVNSWKKLTELPMSLYSKDDTRVFYGFWEIDVDYETFEVLLPIKAKSIAYQLAKDKNNFYHNGEIISVEEFAELKEKLD